MVNLEKLMTMVTIRLKDLKIENSRIMTFYGLTHNLVLKNSAA